MNTERTVWTDKGIQLRALLQRIGATDIRKEEIRDFANNAFVLVQSCILPDGWTKEQVDSSYANIQKHSSYPDFK